MRSSTSRPLIPGPHQVSERNLRMFAEHPFDAFIGILGRENPETGRIKATESISRLPGLSMTARGKDVSALMSTLLTLRHRWLSSGD